MLTATHQPLFVVGQGRWNAAAQEALIFVPTENQSLLVFFLVSSSTISNRTTDFALQPTSTHPKSRW